MTPTTSTLKIAHNLARTIPDPYRPPPKAQKSWRQLKANQWLAGRVDVHLRGSTYPAGTLWQVTDPTDMGVKLIPRQGSGVLVWSEPVWQTYFSRAKKPKTVKVKED